MNNLSEVIELHAKQKEDFRKLKLHEYGLSRIESMREEIEMMNRDITNMREKLRDRVFSFIFDSTRNTPTSVSGELTIRDNSIYCYQKSEKAELHQLNEEILSEIKEGEKEKVSRLLHMLEENYVRIDKKFKCSPSEGITVEYKKGSIVISRSSQEKSTSIHLTEIPQQKWTKWMEDLIKNADEIKYLFSEMKEHLLKTKLKLRQLNIWAEEIIETGNYNNELTIFDGDLE